MEHSAEDPAIQLKRVGRIEIGSNKHAAISLASNNTFSLVQFMHVMFDDRPISRPITGTIRLTADGLIRLHKMLSWVIVRLQPKQYDQENIPYVTKLHQMFYGSKEEAELELHMLELGFPPTSFSGQAFNNFNQPVEDANQRKQDRR